MEKLTLEDVHSKIGYGYGNGNGDGNGDGYGYGYGQLIRYTKEKRPVKTGLFFNITHKKLSLK